MYLFKKHSLLTSEAKKCQSEIIYCFHSQPWLLGNLGGNFMPAWAPLGSVSVNGTAIAGSGPQKQMCCHLLLEVIYQATGLSL